MKKYGSIDSFRLLNIKVLYNDNVRYEGMVEDAPEDIRNLKYSKVEVGNPTILYVYEED